MRQLRRRLALQFGAFVEMTEDALRIHGVPDYRAAVVRKPLPIFTKPSSGSRARPRSRRNRIPDPVGFISVDRDHVETAGRRYPIALQIMLGGENQLSLLGRR